MTESLAAKIAARTGVAQTDVHNVADASADEAEGYDLLLLGSSTWGCGELQDDWYDGVKVLKKADLSNKEWNQIRQWRKQWKEESQKAEDKE